MRQRRVFARAVRVLTVVSSNGGRLDVGVAWRGAGSRSDPLSSAW